MAGLFVLNKVEPAQHKQSTDNPGHAENTSDRDSVAQISHEEQIVVKALSLDDIASVYVNTTRTLGVDSPTPKENQQQKKGISLTLFLYIISSLLTYAVPILCW